MSDGPAAIARKASETQHSRFPVIDGDIDRIVGIVRTQDILPHALAGERIDLRALARPALFVPESMPALKLLDLFKESRPHLAIVIDEYGSIEGLVTIGDLLEAIVGELPEANVAPEPLAVRRPDGSWLVDGAINLDELADTLGARLESAGGFQTLGGLCMNRLGRLPAAGDRFEVAGPPLRGPRHGRPPRRQGARDAAPAARGGMERARPGTGHLGRRLSRGSSDSD